MFISCVYTNFIPGAVYKCSKDILLNHAERVFWSNGVSQRREERRYIRIENDFVSVKCSNQLSIKKESCGVEGEGELEDVPITDKSSDERHHYWMFEIKSKKRRPAPVALFTSARQTVALKGETIISDFMQAINW